MDIPNRHPQEIEVWYILPAIRKELVVTLKNEGKSQKEIATLLNLTESAISQYLNSKRAKDINLPLEVKTFIKEAVKKITNHETAYQQIQKISEFIKSTKALCQIHMMVEGNLENCDVCYKE